MENLNFTNCNVAKRRMLKEQLLARGITNRKVLTSIMRLDREDFIEDALKNLAYTDSPLSIGHRQTISQPYIVGFMTQELQLTGSERVLEIGTGSGYQTAVLSPLVKEIYTIERVRALASQAHQRFLDLELMNVIVKVGDGSLGEPQQAPFDRILLACAAPEIPKILAQQLAPDGFMILPLATGKNQKLVRVKRQKNAFLVKELLDCHFVKLLGKHGYALA